MTAAVSTKAASATRGVYVPPSQREALVTSLFPVMGKAVADIIANGEAVRGRVPASRVVWGVIEWIDGCMVAGYGLRCLRDVIVEVARETLGEFKLSYQSLRTYRAMLAAKMQGGTVARVQALTGTPVVATGLHPSPKAGAAAREAARHEAAGGGAGEELSPVERILNAVGYGGLGQGARNAAFVKPMIRQVSLTLERKAAELSNVVPVSARGAAVFAQSAAVPLVMARPAAASDRTTVNLVSAQPVLHPFRPNGGNDLSGRSNLSLVGRTAAEVDAEHRAELRARDDEDLALVRRLIAERERRPKT